MVAALLSLYVLWGSTYLAIQVALETMPPFLMAGIRFLLAGGLLYGYARLTGAPPAGRRQWRDTIGLGALFFLGGNGLVVLAETRVASGLAALLIALGPAWIMAFEWFQSGVTPPAGRLAGLALGAAGVVALVGGDGGVVDPLGALMLLGSAISWSLGAVLSKKADLPASTAQVSGMEMLGGGLWLSAAGALTGEGTAVLSLQPSAGSLLAFAWLLVAGSLVGFTVYAWLLRAAGPVLTSTYAFVNPVVAVLLGAAFAREPVGPRVIGAGAVIVCAVALIVGFTPRKAADSGKPAGADS